MQDISMISPDTIFNIAKKIEQTLLDTKHTYPDIEWYISKWRTKNDSHGNFEGYHFYIKNQYNSRSIDIMGTLKDIDHELLLQIAVDLDIEIPWLIYSVAEIKGILDDRYKNLARKFENACKEVYSDPSMAIGKANSALELLIKEICKDESIENCDPKAGIYELTDHILKQFDFLPDKKLNSRIRDIGSGLFKATRTIGELRSKHTDMHGIDKTISDPLYAVFVVNSVVTVGLFLLNYYELRYKPQNIGQSSLEDDEIPF